MTGSAPEGAAAAAPAAPRQFPCRACGANVAFDPRAKALKCPYCGAVEDIPETADAVDEHGFDAALARPRKALAALGPTRVRCSGCGAQSETTALAAACPFCSAPVVAEPSAEDLIAPEAVLPFAFARSAALDKFGAWLGSRWFAPSDLKALAAEDGVKGVYVPYWTFDCFTRTFYVGERGDHYYVTETYVVTVNGRPETRTRQVRHTRWSPASGRVERSFDDVLVPAVRSLPPAKLAELEPWDLKRLEPFKPEFVAGFLATRYEVDLAQGFGLAQDVMRETIRDDCRRDIGGDEQRVHSMKTAWQAVTFKHVLLPVWSAAYRYRNKTWLVLINARTGEVLGDRPYSAWKIAALVLVLLAIGGAVAFFANR